MKLKFKIIIQQCCAISGLVIRDGKCREIKIITSDGMGDPSIDVLVRFGSKQMHINSLYSKYW